MADNETGPQEKPKIYVDDDWKAEAQREKEQLAEDQAKAPAQPEGGPEGPSGHPGEMPQPNFATLVNSLGMQAMMALGGIEDPKTKRRIVDLGMAKFHIDLLGMLQEKTKGNLDDEEAKMVEQVVYELRMAFVQFSQQAAEQIRKQEEEKK